MQFLAIEKRFSLSNPENPEALVVAEIMIEIVKNDKSTTMAELCLKLTDVISTLKKMRNGIILKSVGELFFRYITLNSAQYELIEVCREGMIERGKRFLDRMYNSRSKIAKFCHPFILDGSVILTHSYSRVVVEAFKKAAQAKKHFQVYVTESMPDCSGKKTTKILKEQGIPCQLILDAEVGYIMERVDMVLVGAESVVESGGIINKIGSYQIAICARELNKPFYVLAESFKFARLYPLNQEDLKNQLKDFSLSSGGDTRSDQDTQDRSRPMKDYTPPSYISLLFTDLDILTPSAVSDELIKIYT